MFTLLRELNKKYHRLVLVFDEAQVLASVKGVNSRGLLQFIHNNYDHVAVVLTGSMPGLLEKIVWPTSVEAPGFARYMEEIEVPHWNKAETLEFLGRGLRGSRITFREEELEEVHEELSGIPGFVTYYGLLRVRGSSHVEALNKTIDYAVLQWEHDLEAFLNIYNSPLYLHVLSILANTVSGASWSEIAGELEKKLSRPIGKSTLYRILTNLMKAQIIQKQRDNYVITDRPLRRAVGIIRQKLR